MMALTVKVNGPLFGLVHKGSNHLANSTPPDVCKTPSPAGPVPIPYPIIISKSSDLANGTTTVTADGGQMIAVKDCEYSTCNGDEPGTAGGVVSSTNMKEAKFILYSTDVKMDGKNACRFSDKMTMNHQNTMCLAGTIPSVVQVSLIEDELKQIAKDCNNEENRKAGACDTPPSGKECTKLGTKKHKCCEKKLKSRSENQQPKVRSEVAFDNMGNELGQEAESAARSAANEAYNAAKAAGGSTEGVWANAYFGGGGADFRADVLVGDPATHAYDFKFNCKPTEDCAISAAQKLKYFMNTGVTPQMVHVNGSTCDDEE
jgi:hypothetical protein